MEAPASTTPRVLHLALVTGGDLLDPAGAKLGRVDDLIVRLGEDEYPPVTGLLATLAGRQVFVPADAIAEIEHGRVRMRARRLDLQPFERRPDEVLLKKDVLDRQLINVDGARLVRSNEIELARLDGWYRVVGVDTGLRGLLRRVVPRALAHSVGTNEFLDWASVEPFTGHVPSVRLRVPHPKLARLHPAQLADLVEQASHHEGQEILGAVGGDPELEADVFEELDTDTANRLFGGRSDDEVAGIIARMRADDAADAIADLPQERRQPVLDALPPTMRTKVLVLLGFNPSTAGGLMGMEMLALPRDETVGHALAVLREARADQPEALTTIYTTDGEGRLTGAVPLLALVQSDPATVLGDLADEQAVCVGPESDVADVALLMADYNLVSIPVVDAEDRLIGLITVDDVLEVTIPEDWRRRQPGPHPEHPHPSESPLPSEA